MKYLLNLGITSIVMFVLSRLDFGFHVDGFIWAVLASILLGIVNATLGLILKFFFHAISAGILFILGLGFIIRGIVLILCLKVVDHFMESVSIVGWKASLITAISISIAGVVADSLGKDSE